MSLKDRIKDIEQYFRGIDYYNDCIMVKASFPDKITVVGSEELGIKVTKSEDGIWYYYGNKNEVEIEDIFDLIQSTIRVYEEAKQKATLFRAKCEELKEMFATNPLDKLETLYFGFNIPTNKVVEKPKRKYSRKKKEEKQEISIPTVVTVEEKNENNEITVDEILNG